MEQINYEKLLPAQPRCDAVRLALEAGRFEQRYLIYRSRGGRTAEVRCTACGGTFQAEKVPGGGCWQSGAPAPFGWRSGADSRPVFSGSDALCPLCGKLGRTVHVGRMTLYRGELVDDAWVTEVLRLPAEGRRDRLAALEWCVRRCTGKDGQARWEIWPYTAWVVEEKKVVRLMAFRSFMGSISLMGHWEQRKSFREDFGELGVLAPWDPAALEGTTAENCRLDGYIAAGGKRLVGYLALWRRRPAVENLVAQGCGGLVDELMREEAGRYGGRGKIPRLPQINWKEKRPARMLGLNREEFRLLREMAWTKDDLERFQLVKKAGLLRRPAEDMELLRTRPVYELNRILEEGPRADFWRILRYLRKQKRDWNLLRDYWRLAEGRDLTDSLVRWPRDLRRAHDRVMEERKHRAEEALRERFRERFEALSPLSLQLGGLLIRPCRSQEELIAEGRALHHCVASYGEDHAGGKTAIFFIRRGDRPGEPFFTLELDEERRTVRQNRGLRNCAPPEEVRAFVVQWLSWIRRGVKKTA